MDGIDWLSPQFVGEIPHALACPPQWRPGISSRHRLQQFLQIDQQIWIFEGCLLPATAFLANRREFRWAAID
jgi:hypothetical protein